MSNLQHPDALTVVLIAVSLFAALVATIACDECRRLARRLSALEEHHPAPTGRTEETRAA